MGVVSVIYKITLPLPPSVNSAYGGGSGQRRFKSASYKKWLLKCPAVIDRPKIDKPVCVAYNIYLPDGRLRDIANYEKLSTDFLVNNGILADDNFKIIQHVSLNFKGIDKDNPRVEIEIALQ
jgi:Holliday junction resolvase RusA-like endonuclease